MKLICGDALEELKKMDSNSIDMAITSPPYYNLRDYNTEKQIGHEQTINEYINDLLEVFNEVKRVVKDEGSCWVNIDDVYINQCLAGIPDLFKLRMIESGWTCRNEIIWHKPNAMPSSAKKRFNNDYEKLLFFTKGTNYYFKTQYEPLKTKIKKQENRTIGNKNKYQSDEQEKKVRQGMSKTRGNKLVFLRKNLPNQKDFVRFIRERTTIQKLADNTDVKKTKIEHWFRNDEEGFAYPSTEDWNKVKWLIDDFSEEFSKIDYMLNDITIETDDILKNSDKGRIKRAVWSINTKPFKGYHYAPFPEGLIETPIKACCPDGGIVLDMFMGSGTTGVVCKKLNCDFIGIDNNKSYIELAQKRIEEE